METSGLNSPVGAGAGAGVGATGAGVGVAGACVGSKIELVSMCSVLPSCLPVTEHGGVLICFLLSFNELVKALAEDADCPHVAAWHKFLQQTTLAKLVNVARRPIAQKFGGLLAAVNSRRVLRGWYGLRLRAAVAKKCHEPGAVGGV